MSAVVMLDQSWTGMIRALGLRPDDVARRAGIAPEVLAQESFRLPVAEYFRLVDTVECEADDPTLALRMTRLAPTGFSPVMFAALCSSTFVVAARRIATHKRLIAPIHVPHQHTKEGFEVGWNWDDPTLRSPRLLVATELVMMTQIARVGTGARICPIRVVSPMALEPKEAYKDYFGVAPELGERTKLVFSAADAARPFLTANDVLWQSFEPTLRRRLNKLNAETPVVERTRSVLLECLPAGESELSQSARRLGMSGRTLQRRLAKEGVSYREVVQSTREHLAQHYLTSTRIPYAEIAFLLGFDKPSSFFRAFRTWTGSTPDVTRRAQVPTA